MFEGYDISKILMLAIPFFIIQVGLIVYAMVDLVRRKKVRGGNKIVWGIVILFVNLLGPIIYLIFRGDDE